MTVHWLTTAAVRGELGDASGAELPADGSIEEVWSLICDFLDCTPAQLAGAVAKAFRLEIADLDRVDHAALALVPQKLAQSLRVLPMHVGDREITLATSEPIDYDAERQIGFVTSRRTHFQVAEPEALQRAIHSAYSVKVEQAVIGSADLERAFSKVQPDQAALARAPARSQDAGIVKICRLILYEAVQAGATEIHMSQGTSAGRIQFKVDGKLTTFIRVPLETLASATQRLRAMADIDDTDERVIKSLNVRIDRRPYDIRVQTIPGYPNHLVMGVGGVESEVTTAEPENEKPRTATVERRPDDPTPAPAPALNWERRDDESEGHILVVDDDDGGRLLMRTILERNGFRVSEADDGSTALPFLQHAEDIDGILLDLMMKNVDGMEVLKKVRKSKKLAALPVIILTASQDPEDERRLLRAGADDYLRKPIDHRQLVERIRAVMKRAQSR